MSEGKRIKDEQGSDESQDRGLEEMQTFLQDEDDSEDDDDDESENTTDDESLIQCSDENVGTVNNNQEDTESRTNILMRLDYDESLPNKDNPKWPTEFKISDYGSITIDANAMTFYFGEKEINRKVITLWNQIVALIQKKATNLQRPSDLLASETFGEGLGYGADDLASQITMLFENVLSCINESLMQFLTADMWSDEDSCQIDTLLRPFVNIKSIAHSCVAILNKANAKLPEICSDISFMLDLKDRRAQPVEHYDDGMIKSIFTSLGNIRRENLAKKSAIKKCQEKYRNFIDEVMSELHETVPSVLACSLTQALSHVIREKSGVDFFECRKKIIQELENGCYQGNLAKALSYFPYEPLVVRAGFNQFGDKDNCISSVVEKLGVDSLAQKKVLLQKCVEKLPSSTEAEAIQSRITYYQLLKRLNMQAGKVSLEALGAIINKIANFDKAYRTVGSITFNTRWEAFLTRRDISWIKKIINEDMTPCLQFLYPNDGIIARIKWGFRVGASKFVGHILEPEILKALNTLDPTKTYSPLFEMFLRGLRHFKDSTLYVGNKRYESPELASQARPAKKASVLEIFRQTGNRYFWFRIHENRKLKDVLFGKHVNAEALLSTRYFEGTPPKGLTTIWDFFEWQAAFDFFDPDPVFIKSISADGLPLGYISTVDLPLSIMVGDVLLADGTDSSADNISLPKQS